MKIILIGGYPKGYSEPFHINTKSGRVLHKIVDELKLNVIYFDLWNNQSEEDKRTLSKFTKRKLLEFSKKFQLIALGRYIEDTLNKNGFECVYLPHPASRDKKYLDKLKDGLAKFK